MRKIDVRYRAWYALYDVKRWLRDRALRWLKERHAEGQRRRAEARVQVANHHLAFVGEIALADERERRRRRAADEARAWEHPRSGIQDPPRHGELSRLT